MKQITIRYRETIFVAIILCLVLVVNLFYLTKKSGYFVDEGMTLFLSNGNYNGAVTSKSNATLSDFIEQFVWKGNIPSTIENVSHMLKELTSAGNYSEKGTVEWYDAARELLQGQRGWVKGKELFDQLTVSGETRFQYAQVLVNQAVDVHPPLFYLAVHTIFSLFPGTYSDVYLFTVNFLALALACIVLYKAAHLLFGDPSLAVIALAVYGFSQGFLSCAMYFRMYAIFSLFVILTVYVHLLIENAQYKIDRKRQVQLVLVTVFGFYTHYYYIIFLFPLFVLTVWKLLRNHKKKEFWKYLKDMVMAGIISLIIWPLSVYHILFGYRGTEAVSRIISDGLAKRINAYYMIIRQAFFWNQDWLFVLAIALGILLCVRYIRKNTFGCFFKRTETSLFIICTFYLLFICQIAPSRADRYIMCIYPVFSLLIVAIIAQIVKRFKNKTGFQFLPAVLVGVLFLGAFLFNTPNYLYLENAQYKLNIEKEPSEINCLMLSDDDWRGFPVVLKLSEFQEVIVLGEDEKNLLISEKPQDADADLLIYVLKELEQEENLAEVCEYLGYNYEEIQTVSSDMEDFNAYLLEVEKNG